MKQFLERVATAAVLIAIGISIFFYTSPIYTSITFLVVLGIILFCEWPRIFSPASVPFWLIAPFYLFLPFGLMVYVNQSEQYRPLLLYLFLMVAAHDTGGYIFGNLFGKHKLAPSISPGKTWEGFFGGYLFASAILYLFLYLFDVSVSHIPLLVFTFVVCAVATVGDLFESFLKRRAGVKDSGMLLPGHGGFLDRFDGLIFTMLLFFLLRDYLIMLFHI